MIPLLKTKIADTAQTGIFASVTKPFSQFLGGAWGEAKTEMSIMSEASLIPSLLHRETVWGGSLEDLIMCPVTYICSARGFVRGFDNQIIAHVV